MNARHDSDFYAWTQEQAGYLRAGRWHDIDLEHLAEELEHMGARERRELSHRLAVLLAHPLKWQHQPERRGNSWRLTIEVQRLDLAELLDQSPSLRLRLGERVSAAYRKAILLAAQETGLSKSQFPAECPYPVEGIMDAGYWPE